VTAFEHKDLSFGNAVLTLVLGAGVHIVQKILFECTSKGADGLAKKFHQPFFFTWLGSVGLFVTFMINLKSIILRFLSVRGFCSSFCMIGIATSFNLFAGFLANYSSLYLNYSVSLMLRSSTLIFGCLISTFYLGRPLLSHQLWGVAIVIGAIIIVGVAAMMSQSTTTHIPATSLQVLLWIIGRVLSKGFQAISMLIEERVMKSADMTPVELSGISGLWSMTLATVFLAVSGITDTWAMIANNRMISMFSLVIIITFGLWNIMCLYVTQKASAIARMLLDQLTIVVVWVVQLIIWWLGFPKQGEAWNSWSWLQLVGYFVLVFGAGVYQRLIRIDVADDALSPLAEPLSDE
jgi:hypothetical protein